MNKGKSVRQASVWFVFCVLLLSTTLTGLFGAAALALFPDFLSDYLLFRPLFLILASVVVSLLIGTLLSIPLTRFYVKPLRKMMEATKAVAGGDFSVRVETDQSLGDFAEFADSFNLMAASLSQHQVLNTDFVNTLAHEFKTPAASIEGFARLLQKPGLSDEQRTLYADTVMKEAHRLSEMSRSVLLLSQCEGLDIVPDQQLYSLDEQLRECISQQERAWLAKELNISGDLMPDRWYGNRDLMGHLWSNLLSNAIKFTPEHGFIFLTLTESPEHVIVTIRDTGIGMDEETACHIFDKFWQADTSRRSEGTGLGLSIARRVAALCGGDIRVESAPGKGSSFTVTLPIAQITEL